MENLLKIAKGLDEIQAPRMRFGIEPVNGYVASNNRDVIRLLCDIWNARKEIAALIRKGVE